jgi:hypothetical protein
VFTVLHCIYTRIWYISEECRCVYYDLMSLLSVSSCCCLSTTWALSSWTVVISCSLSRSIACSRFLKLSSLLENNHQYTGHRLTVRTLYKCVKEVILNVRIPQIFKGNDTETKHTK